MSPQQHIRVKVQMIFDVPYDLEKRDTLYGDRDPLEVESNSLGSVEGILAVLSDREMQKDVQFGVTFSEASFYTPLGGGDDKLPGMWDKSDFVGGETDNLPEKWSEEDIQAIVRHVEDPNHDEPKGDYDILDDDTSKDNPMFVCGKCACSFNVIERSPDGIRSCPNGHVYKMVDGKMTQIRREWHVRYGKRDQSHGPYHSKSSAESLAQRIHGEAFFVDDIIE